MKVFSLVVNTITIKTLEPQNVSVTGKICFPSVKLHMLPRTPPLIHPSLLFRYAGLTLMSYVCLELSLLGIHSLFNVV